MTKHNDNFLAKKRKLILQKQQHEIDFIERDISNAILWPFTSGPQIHHKIKRLAALFDRKSKDEFVKLRASRGVEKISGYIEDSHLVLLENLGARCVCCGSVKNLEIDHKYNDGFYDRRLYEDVWIKYIFDEVRASGQLQILCTRCHRYKHLITGYGCSIFEMVRHLSRRQRHLLYREYLYVLRYYLKKDIVLAHKILKVSGLFI